MKRSLSKTSVRVFLLTAFGLTVVGSVAFGQTAPTDRELQLMQRLETLERRLEALEGKVPAQSSATSNLLAPSSATPSTAPTVAAGTPAPSAPSAGTTSTNPFEGVTASVYFDGYYGFNFNHPLGRANLLRSNDVSSNSFTLNQADLVIERAPDVAAGRRAGLRVDLMYGQNTDTLQGSTANENRPQIYRNLFQLYGSYVVPVGSGLQVDFGKFASSLGMETNYAKDQMNYSRAYLFNFLPYYHTGFRATYKFNDKVTGQYWLVNGANQAEDFNGFKSNGFLFTITPNKNVTWQANYYFGQENRDLVPVVQGQAPVLPTQPGLSFQRAFPRPNGRTHIFDTYLSWNANSKLTLGAEADYVVARFQENARPQHVEAGAAYAKYQVSSKWALAGRFEYLSDSTGLFSGVDQSLKETTLTASYQPVDGFQIRTEFRRDFSNRNFFLTAFPGQLKREQNTATLGMIWWFGGKQGAW